MTGVATGMGIETGLTDVELGRLRWRCRRGMRELDLLLTRYLDEQYGAADADHRRAFLRLLEMPDPVIHACFLGRAVPPDPLMASLVARMTAGARNAR